MGEIKRTDRFTPTPPPQQASAHLRDWLREEFERLSLSSNATLELLDALRAAPRMFLAGDADDILDLDPFGTQITGYTLSASLGDVPQEPDPVAGTITIPRKGLYRFTFYVYGLQPSNVQNETINLEIIVNGGTQVISTLEVASNRTQDRSLAVTLTRQVNKDDVIAMLLSATASLGLFQIQETSMEVSLVDSADPEQVQDVQLNWNVT